MFLYQTKSDRKVNFSFSSFEGSCFDFTILQGWAVRAGEAILRGTFICEYIGEILDENEANKRRNRFKFCSDVQLLVLF